MLHSTCEFTMYPDYDRFTFIYACKDVDKKKSKVKYVEICMSIRCLQCTSLKTKKKY